jgi:hypothetical protein
LHIGAGTCQKQDGAEVERLFDVFFGDSFLKMSLKKIAFRRSDSENVE